MEKESFHFEIGEQGLDLFLCILQVVCVAFVCAVAAIGAAVFMIDQTDRVNVMDFYRQFNILQDHLIVMDCASQGNDVKVVISKTDRDPRLDEFLQAVVHAVNDECITMNNWFFNCHIYNISPSFLFRNLPAPFLPSQVSPSTIIFPRRKTFSG